MKHRRMILLFAMLNSLVWLLAGFWWLSSHLLNLSPAERIVGLVVVTAGWHTVSMMAIRQLESWWEGRECNFPERSAQPLEAMNVTCEVCGGDEFLEGPKGGLCTNIKCVGCSAEYNFGPGIMERIYRIKDM